MTDTILDSSTNNSKESFSWGGKREGAGRKKGSYNTQTLESKATKKAFIDRVNTNADKLFNAQLDLAVGEKYLMVVRTIGQGAKQRRETEIVTDPDLIRQYLDEELENTDEEYYFMTTKPASNLAIEGLLNRAFGKATEKVDLSNEDGTLRPTSISDDELKSRIESYLKRTEKDVS